MADRTRARGVSTAKARRKNDAARNRAHGLATRGRTKAGLGTEDEPAETTAAAVPAQVPSGRQAEATYVIGEHHRRDTGGLVVILDLLAPDAPEDGHQPTNGPDGTLLAYAVECVTHHSGPHHYASSAQARREAKSSHKWCADCKADLTQNPKVRNKASAQTKSRNGGTG